MVGLQRLDTDEHKQKLKALIERHVAGNYFSARAADSR
jgi:hypothetical protein